MKLTDKIRIYINAYGQPPFGRAVEGTVELLQEALDKITEYEKLEKQGKLIKLPCKVGDKVYYLWKGEISEMEVTEISVGIEEPLYEMRYINNATRIHFYEEEFGQTIFHTPEEAEAALKKMEGENENNN